MRSQHPIDDVMVSVLASSAVGRAFGYRSDHTKTVRRKSKYWSAWNQNNVSKWSDMSTRGLLFQWASTITIQPVLLVVKKNEPTQRVALEQSRPSYHWILNYRHDIVDKLLNWRLATLTLMVINFTNMDNYCNYIL